jgi:hypothetical protein
MCDSSYSNAKSAEILAARKKPSNVVAFPEPVNKRCANCCHYHPGDASPSGWCSAEPKLYVETNSDWLCDDWRRQE